MSVSRIFVSLILVSLSLFAGGLGFSIYADRLFDLAIRPEVKGVEALFRDFVVDLSRQGSVVLPASLKYGSLMFSVDDFQYLSCGDEAVFSSYVVSLVYICDFSIYPTIPVVIDSGSLYFFNYSLVGCCNKLSLKFYPHLSFVDDVLYVRTVSFDLGSSIYVFDGLSFHSSVLVFDRLYRPLSPSVICLRFYYGSLVFDESVSVSFDDFLSVKCEVLRVFLED